MEKGKMLTDVYKVSRLQMRIKTAETSNNLQIQISWTFFLSIPFTILKNFRKFEKQIWAVDL